MVIVIFVLFIFGSSIEITIPLQNSQGQVNFIATTCSGSDNFTVQIQNSSLTIEIPRDKYISRGPSSITVCPNTNINIRGNYQAMISSYFGHYSIDQDLNENNVQRCGQYCATLVYGPVNNKRTISNANVNVGYLNWVNVYPSIYTVQNNTVLTVTIDYQFKPNTNLIISNSSIQCNRNYNNKSVSQSTYNLNIIVSNPTLSASIQLISGPRIDNNYLVYTVSITNTGVIPFKVSNIYLNQGSVISINPDIRNQVLNPGNSFNFEVKVTSAGTLYFDLVSDQPYCNQQLSLTLQLNLPNVNASQCTLSPNPISIINQSGSSNQSTILCGGQTCDNVTLPNIPDLSLSHISGQINVRLNNPVNRNSDIIRINATKGSNVYTCELNVNYVSNIQNIQQCNIIPNPLYIRNQLGSTGSVSLICGNQNCRNAIFTGVPQYLLIRPDQGTIQITLTGTPTSQSDTIQIETNDQNNNRYRCDLDIIYQNINNPCRSRI